MSETAAVPPLKNAGSDERRFEWLNGLVGLFTLLLMGVTWPLWMDSPSPASPRIPLWGGLTSVPAIADQLSLIVTLLGCGGLISVLWIRSSFVRRISSLLYLLGLLSLVSLDQHRLQPWVTQFLLFGIYSQFASGRLFLRGWGWIIAGIYFWSAVSKLDVTFFTQQGQLFLNGFLDPLGIDHTYWSPQSRYRLAMLFPAGELLTVVLLLIPRTRRWGLFLSILMHATLIWILGFGLRHEWGVLIWNPFFILQNIIVFGGKSAQGASQNSAELMSPSLLRRIASGAIPLLAVLYPALELIGDCDHWPAWGVYCARPAQVKILIPDFATETLLEDLKKHIGLPAPLDTRLPLNLDGWCFENRRCPIYPQERFRLALALALLEGHLGETALTVEVRSTPDRWTGERTLTTLNGFTEVEKRCAQFRLNTVPRR